MLTQRVDLSCMGVYRSLLHNGKRTLIKIGPLVPIEPASMHRNFNFYRVKNDTPIKVMPHLPPTEQGARQGQHRSFKSGMTC